MTTEEQILDDIFTLVILRERHLIYDHGVGFCKVCGELRKRCECSEFTPNECDCK